MKILVVDDHHFNRELMGFILSDHGFDYVEAINGAQACEIFSSTSDIDLVLMDINMPVMDGYEATQRIKATLGDKLVPVLFVTALDDDETLTKCLTVGGDDFVAKPVNESVLLAKLHAHQRTILIHRQLEETNKALEYHRRVMEREHAIVDHVFQNGLKQIDVNCPNLKTHVSPMSMFNGDLYLAAPSPTGGLYVLLGDFTGHGLSAAIGCLPVSNIFSAMAEKHVSVGDMAREINLRLQSLLPSNMFFCAVIIELSQSGDRLSIWAGGMNDILVLDKQGDLIDRLASLHMPLGILNDHEFDTEVRVYHPQMESRVFVYTDGVIEACNNDGEQFGEPRLEALLSTHPEDNVEAVWAAVEEFQHGGVQEDDISMVELLCSPLSLLDSNGKLLSVSNANQLERETLPWVLSLTLSPAHMREGVVIPELLNVINNIRGVGSHKDLLYTILTELYNNALEYGLLKLDSGLKLEPEGFTAYYKARECLLRDLDEGEIVFSLSVVPSSEQQPPSLIFSFTDTGKGFDFVDVANAGEEDDLSFGRGIDMVRALCDSLEYSNQGRTVEVTYLLT